MKANVESYIAAAVVVVVDFLNRTPIERTHSFITSIQH